MYVLRLTYFSSDKTNVAKFAVRRIFQSHMKLYNWNLFDYVTHFNSLGINISEKQIITHRFPLPSVKNLPNSKKEDVRGRNFHPKGDGGSGRRPLPPDHLTF